MNVPYLLFCCFFPPYIMFFLCMGVNGHVSFFTESWPSLASSGCLESVRMIKD